MKTILVLAGSAPGWVRNQVRVTAETLTEDGRVLIATSDDVSDPEHLPGSAGNSTLFGVAQSGYPLWTGRMSSLLGIRRRHDRMVLVRFDNDRHILLCVVALVSRLRREHLVVNNLSTTQSAGTLRRATSHIIDATAHANIGRSSSSAVGGPSIALFVCGSDTQLARLAVGVAEAMSSDAAGTWRLVIQADEQVVGKLLQESDRPHFASYEPPGPIDDLLESSDVVIVRDTSELATQSPDLSRSAALVLVGHPLGGRMTPRFDGAWLIRSDVSSLIVALEHFRKSRFGGPAASDVRRDSRRLVESVRSLQLASSA